MAAATASISILRSNLRPTTASTFLLWKACREQAKDMLASHWSTIDILAHALLEQGQLRGDEAHQIIQQAIGETGVDWRLKARGIQEKSGLVIQDIRNKSPR